ncbi:hypothetical protein LFREDSHE_22260 [Shewanella baltica]
MLTFTNTRFLAFIELGYLYEAAKATDEHFVSIIASLKEEDESRVENINATRNSLLRAVFISSYAILEQNLDELIKQDHKRLKVSISPNDLKYGGILRSLLYAEKVLGYQIDQSQKHWVEVKKIQKLRNYLVHYGYYLSDEHEHLKLYQSLDKSEYVSISHSIHFNIEQIERLINLYMDCVDDFSQEVIETAKP